MIEQYFDHILSRLTLDEMGILGVLLDYDATATFKAMKKKILFEHGGLSEANFRKIIYRLDALNFIETVSGNKEHMYFITGYGKNAMEKSIPLEEVTYL